MRIALFDTFPQWPLARQTPGGGLAWGSTEFVINPTGGRFDAVCVFDGMTGEVTLDCPPDRTLFVIGEPPSIKSYDEDFTRQFHAVITCHSDLAHPRKIFDQAGFPWHAGVARDPGGGRRSTRGYDEFTKPAPAKSKLLSVVVSDKAVTPGHRHRRAFVAALKAHFGDRLDVFGRGIRDIDDKADAILPYRYHIALENSQFPDYWTEKLADAYLCEAHPFYWGCPNLERYFPSGSFTPINIYDPAPSIATIEAAIAADRYTAASADLAEAKRRVLDRYNIFAMLAERFAVPSAIAPTSITLRGEAFFQETWRKRMSKRLRRAVPRALRRRAKPL